MTKTNRLMCINAQQPDEPRVAVIDNHTLVSIETQEHEVNRSCGNIYLGKITSIQSGIDAVFVDFGSQRHGFLPFKEIAHKYYQSEPTEGSKIADLVKVGQEVLVQVSREEKPNKGAALTTHLSLAGAYLVVMSNQQKSNGISKKADASERQKIKEILTELKIPDHLSVIVRTEGINRSKEELAWDLECLIHHWENIHNASHDAKVPVLIHQEADALIRSVRDRLRKNIDSIVVDHEPTYQKLKTYLSLTRPEFADKLTYYQNKVPIFAHFGVQSHINALFMRKIQLPSGGSIVIDHTEAMTVIDVNSSKSTGARNIEETALKTNKEAAEELLKQMVLRDIGGIIAVDFIDMTQEENKSVIEKIVNDFIARERVKMRFEPISSLTGCMYLSRQRTGPSIIDQHYTECPTCDNTGIIRTVLSTSNSILQKVEEVSASESTKVITVQTSSDVSCFMLNEKRNYIEAIEKRYDIKVVVVSNEHYNNNKYTIKRTCDENKFSYQQRESLETSSPKWLNQSSQSGPLVPQNLYKEHPKQESVIQRFMNKIMPPKTESTQVYEPKSPRQPGKKKEGSSQQQQQQQQQRRPNRRRSRSANQTRRGAQRPTHTNKPTRPQKTSPQKPQEKVAIADRLDD